MPLTVTRRGILAGAAVLLIAAVCVRLGFWQLQRLEQRRERNAALSAALARPPLELTGDSLAAVLADPSAYQYRRARVEGVYLPEAELVVRGRARDGRPGVHLVTPLRIQGARAAVAVNRGWAPAADAATVDPVPLREPGLRSVEGVLLPLAEGSASDRVVETGAAEGRVRSAQRPSRSAIGARTPAPLLPLYLQQLPAAEDPSLPARLPLPDLAGDGPHLGYALQWFSFAAIAVGGFLLLAWSRSRRPR